MIKINNIIWINKISIVVLFNKKQNKNIMYFNIIQIIISVTVNFQK